MIETALENWLESDLVEFLEPFGFGNSVLRCWPGMDSRIITLLCSYSLIDTTSFQLFPDQQPARRMVFIRCIPLTSSHNFESFSYSRPWAMSLCSWCNRKGANEMSGFVISATTNPVKGLHATIFYRETNMLRHIPTRSCYNGDPIRE